MFIGTIKYLKKNAKCQVLTVQPKDTNYVTKWKSKIPTMAACKRHSLLTKTQQIRHQKSYSTYHTNGSRKQGGVAILIANKARFKDSPGKQRHYILVKGIYSIVNIMMIINTQASNSWHTKSHKASTTGHGELIGLDNGPFNGQFS